MKKFSHFILAILSILGLTTCSDDVSITESNQLTFIGDSQVRGWNVKKHFKGYHTRNFGVNGSGVALLEETADAMIEQRLIVLCGTNDLCNFVKLEDVPQYAVRFINALSSFDANGIYIISVMPRNNGAELDRKIREFNSQLKSLTDTRPGMTFIDAYDRFVEGENRIKDDYTKDGLHLSKMGYELLTEIVKDYL